jgi:hypothetical protein
LCQALELAVESKAVLPLLWALLSQALLLADEGEIQHAVELYALASRYPLVADSRWFADVVGRPITAATDTLPADQIAILQERGRGRDLQATVEELLSELRT